MLKKRKVLRKKKKRSRKKSGFFLKRWMIQFIIISICIFLSYCLWLDFQIRREFEGKKWSVPARVYAQPVELYIGRDYTLPKLITELKKKSYHSVMELSGAGQYSKKGNVLEIYTRRFHYWDTTEVSRRLRIHFNNGIISAIRDIYTDRNISVVRLEPELIGKILPLHDEDRVLIDFEQIPRLLIDALIAVEDRNYFEHHGIDPKGILRSAFVNLISGKIRQGGSTLTQQLVKNMLLVNERTFARKVNEIIMAILLDYHYSKADILTAYVNEIFLGQNGARSIHGFSTAAEFYFSKPLSELSLDQIALLTGMVKGASYYNPRRHPERALNRRNVVLALMLDQGFIDTWHYKVATKKQVHVTKKPDWNSARYPAFLDLVRRHLKRDYKIDDLRNDGLQIHTTLDTKIQEHVESSVRSSLVKLDKSSRFKVGTLQTAVVLTSQHDGEVLALLGSRNKNNNAFNRALDAKRPIGSLIKPAIYLTALNEPERYHVLSELDDSPITWKQENGQIWRPKNYDNRSHGKVPLIRSFSKSYNLSTVRLGMALGLDKVMRTLRNLGIDVDISELPSLLLGAIDLSPYQTTQMYQTIASGGLQQPLKTVRAVLDGNGKPLLSHTKNIRESMKAETAFLTQYLLAEVVKNGTARRLAQALPALMPLAGKTGTTNALRDSWFAGFGDRLLGVVWVGRDDNKSTKLTGSSGAMQVWLDIMKQLKPVPLTLLSPEGIEWRKFPDASEPISNCHYSRAYPFVRGYIPPSLACF